MLTFRLALSGRVLVLLAAAVALCMMRLVLASRPAVFALLDRTAFWGDWKEVSVCRAVRAAFYNSVFLELD
jgi:hypothetical protein